MELQLRLLTKWRVLNVLDFRDLPSLSDLIARIHSRNASRRRQSYIKQCEKVYTQISAISNKKQLK